LFALAVSPDYLCAFILCDGFVLSVPSFKIDETGLSRGQMTVVAVSCGLRRRKCHAGSPFRLPLDRQDGGGQKEETAERYTVQYAAGVTTLSRNKLKNSRKSGTSAT
jgi:hypothetical protein